MDEKTRKIRRMATWTIAIFATIFAVTFATLWLFNVNLIGSGFKAIGVIFSQAWVILLIDLVLCGGVFLGYRLYLDSRK